MAGILAADSLFSQTQLVSNDFFPAGLEFKEVKVTGADKDLRDPGELVKLEHGPILLEAGLTHYARRTYTLVNSGTLAIEVMKLIDARGAYSLLTLLSRIGVQTGPPGDFFSSDASTLLLAVGNYCVRIRSEASGDLSRRMATSVANRIGRHESNSPALVRHIPQDTCESSSIRYFLGPQALGTFGIGTPGAALKPPAAVEVAQAHCAVQEQAGTLTLLSFPTIQIAEQYFKSGSLYDREAAKDIKLYARQTGPLVGILEGNFAPEVADKTLGTIKFSYSVKWIFDRNKEQPRTIWGVPVRILSTVVRSILFTALLCLLSIVGGILIAAGRVFARRRWGRSDDDAYIRLKLNEN